MEFLLYLESRYIIFNMSTSLSKAHYDKVRDMGEKWLTTSEPFLPKKLLIIIALGGFVLLILRGDLFRLGIWNGILLFITIYAGFELFGREKRLDGFTEGFAQGMDHPTSHEIDVEYNNFLESKKQKPIKKT